MFMVRLLKCEVFVALRTVVWHFSYNGNLSHFTLWLQWLTCRKSKPFFMPKLWQIAKSNKRQNMPEIKMPICGKRLKSSINQTVKKSEFFVCG